MVDIRTGAAHQPGQWRRPVWVGLLVAALIAALIAVAVLAGGSADGPLSRLLPWIMAEQRAWHAELARTVQALRGEASPATAWALILAAFLYGMFHAAGPGHGKAVMATYLLTQPAALRRGLVLSVLAALLQGGVAIALVEICFTLLGLVHRDMLASAVWLERASYACVMLLGVLLVVRAGRQVWRALATRHRAMAGPATGCGHRHHHHGHGDGAACSHVVPVRPTAGWREGLGVILAIGVRPCSGALLVLLMAHVVELRWAGIAAVAAMSTGTALAVSGLATATVYARSLAGKLTDWTAGSMAAIGGSVVALLGGGVVAALGGALLAASLSAPVRGGPF